jgi:hypothetical protein
MRKRTYKTRKNGWTSESGRNAARARWSRVKVATEVSEEDDYRREVEDRRGRVVRMVESVDAMGRRFLFGVRFSLSGRSDQFDLFDPRDGRCLFTGGANALGLRLARVFLNTNQ